MKYLFIILIVGVGIYALMRKNEAASQENTSEDPDLINSPLSAIEDEFKKVSDAIQNQDIEFIEGNAFKLLNRLATTGKERIDEFLKDRYVNKNVSGLKVDNKIPIDYVIPRNLNVGESAVIQRDKEEVIRLVLEEEEAKRKAVKEVVGNNHFANKNLVIDQRFVS